MNESDSEYVETDSDSDFEILENDYHDDDSYEDEYLDEVVENIPDDE